MSKVGSAMAMAGPIFAGLGLIVSAGAAIWDNYAVDVQGTATAMIQGGDAATRAQAEMQKRNDRYREGSVLDRLFSASQGEITAEINKQIAAMGPQEQAQARVRLAQTDYNNAVKQFGIESPQAIAQSRILADATDAAEQQDHQAAEARKSYSDRLVESTQVMQGVIGMSLSLEQQTNRLRDSSKNAAEAERDHGRASNEYRDASLQLEQQVDATANAALNKAKADNISRGEAAAAQAGADAYRAELNRLANDQDGRVRQAALANIDRLGNTELQAYNTANATSGFHTEIVRLPSGRDVVITTPGMDAARNNVRGLAQEIRNINGKDVSIFVSGTGKNAQKGGIASAGRLATGGPVSGPGTGTSDEAGLYALSHGEHVWTAREVDAAGGHGAMELMRKEVIRRGGGRADGGAANVRLNTSYRYSGPNPNEIFNSVIEQYFGTMMGAGGKGSAGGAQRWAGTVLQALAMLNQPSYLLGTTLRRMNQESGGNPYAINLWDSNARRGTPSIGLMQTIMPTFRAYHDPRTSNNIYDPLANIMASMRYAIARYGSLAAAYNRRGGYDNGGPLMPGTTLVDNTSGGPEMVLSRSQGQALEQRIAGSGGDTYHVTVNISADDIKDLQDINEFFNKFVKTSRTGPRSTAGVR